YSGRRSFYLPQFFRDNLELVKFTTNLLDIKTAYQYQREGRALLRQGAEASQQRLALLLDAMHGDVIAPPEHVIHLRQGLAEHFDADVFLKCESMAALVGENMPQIRVAE